jgi:hypothetical protein
MALFVPSLSMTNTAYSLFDNVVMEPPDWMDT